MASPPKLTLSPSQQCTRPKRRLKLQTSPKLTILSLNRIFLPLDNETKGLKLKAQTEAIETEG